MNFSPDHLAQRFSEASPGMRLYMAVFLWLVVCLINIGLVQLLWNVTLPKIGPFGRISYGQALLLMLLMWAVGGGLQVAVRWMGAS